VGLPIHRLVLTPSGKCFLAVAKKPGTDDSNDEEMLRVMPYDLETNKLSKKLCKVPAALLSMGVYCGDNGEDDEHLIVANKRKLMVFHTASLQSVTCLADNGSIGCLAISEARGILATGHESGQITLWHNIPQWLASKRPPTTSTMHWHAHAVSDLVFSVDGNYLHSGGEEGVLTVWQLHSSKNGFVPRLGSAILSLAYCPWDAICAVVCADNSVRLVNIIGMQVGTWFTYLPD
jgi:WD40 repeat protein